MRLRGAARWWWISIPWLLGSGADPGVLVHVDRDSFELTGQDLASDDLGPTLAIAIGSPRHPTPSGVFHPLRVVVNPSWVPGAVARALGATRVPPSSDGPLGVGKIPLERDAIQIHGGAHPLELGKPVSLGCIRVLDEAWLALVDWLETRGALAPWVAQADGEQVRSFRRPIRVIVD